MGTGENSSQTIFHLYPQQTVHPPPICTISTASSSSPILYNGLRAADTSVAESILNIRTLIHSQSRIAIARSLRGKEAQGLIDLIDQVIAFPELDERLRKQCLHLLYKICRACEMLPASYTLRQELIRVGKIHYCGGFADVSEGEYMGRRVAIKHLRFGTKDAFNNIFKRFCREIIGWKGLCHSNVLPLLGVSVSADPHSFRIVYEWMRNGNVMEYTKSNPGMNRLQLLSEVMSGATYLHELGVVHGDLKGANILVDDNGAIRLADFGLMAISVDLSTIPLSATTVSTAGTARWMSPELLFGQNSPPTRESDCYALGMVVYEVLTGLRPFHNLGHYAVVITIQRGERPKKPDNAGCLGFSNTLWRLVRMCWSRPPSARPTARELLRYFEEASRTWVPPPEYPISDCEGAGPDFSSGGERSSVACVLAGSLLTFAMMCVLLLRVT